MNSEHALVAKEYASSYQYSVTKVALHLRAAIKQLEYKEFPSPLTVDYFVIDSFALPTAKKLRVLSALLRPFDKSGGI